MPTITFSLKDLQSLVGKKLNLEEVKDLVHYGKGDFEGYDKETDEIKVDFGDTNLPYLWSVEGFARLIKGILEKEKGVPKLKIEKGNYNVIVDTSVKKVRPFISSFVAKGKKIDDYLLKQMIQLQEKLCENYGRGRQKVAIGIYRCDMIKFPVNYKATDPESIKFMPLDFKKEMTQQEILEDHPKGKDYAWILKGAKKYPILIDSKDDVLSFPPIINSATTGKLEEGNNELFFEATGTDEDFVLLATNIFAQALYDRGFKIYSVNIKYGNKKMITPKSFDDSIKIKSEDIKKVIGLELKDNEIKKLLEKVRYDYNKGKVIIPDYRRDILHIVDIIEDIGIAYGYDKIEEKPLVSYTIGSTSKLVDFIDRIREILVGSGFNEIMSPILNNKHNLTSKMNIKDFNPIEIENPMSDNYSVIRGSILPILFEFLSKNKHVEYPQRIFEEGVVAVNKNKEVVEYERVGAVIAEEKVDYTKIKQILDYLFRMLDIEYDMEEVEHDSFISGRVARVSVKGKKVAFIGEINPKVLENFEVGVPVVGFELNISELFDAINKI